MRNLGTKFAWIQWSVGKRRVESMKERRRAARVEIKVPVRTAVRVQRTGRIGEGRWNLSRDLSELGMYILYDTSIPVGTDVELTFDLPGVARNVPARGIVRRVDPAEGPEGRGGGMALEFTNVLPSSKKAIKDFMKKAISR